MSITVTTRAKSGHTDNWEYCGVKLTIHNIVIPDEKRCPTPSQLDNMDPELETDLRIVGCELIQDSGILLRLPQVALATAQVLYQRFFYSKSFVRHFYEHYAMACIFLAAKLEECPRRIRDVINVFHHIRQIREQRIPTPVMLDQSYSNLKNQVIKAERRLLKELGFCVHAKHPHKLVICYLQALEQEKNAKFVQCAWNYMNDSLRTDLFVRYLPEAIACACIYLASCKLGIPLPRHPAWWEMFAVDEESVREISLCLVRLYARPKPCVAELEAELAKLRKNQMEAKERELELKKVPAGSTPNLGSDQGSINVSPASVTVSEKLSLPSHDGGPLKTDEVKPFRDDRVLPPNSVLASAIATAKAVAANISATKGASDVNRKSNSSSPTVPEHKRTSETSEPTCNDMGKKRESPETTSRKPNKYSLDIAPGRPAAYPNVSPEPLASRKRRHPGKRSSRRRSASHSPSSSESLTDAEHSKGNVPQNPFNQINSRHYRHRRLNAQESVHSTSGSDTPTSSLSPVKRRKKSMHRNRSLSRSSSASSRSSLSSNGDSRPSGMHAHKKHVHRSRRRGSPPAAYRLDSYQVSYNSLKLSSKHRLSSKSSSLANGGGRSLLNRSHPRSKTNEVSDRRDLVSREHRRR
ncbi:hypothetical protein CRM22_005715 [Opisthorchis felineus]|uniref:Cyclin-like domain-containing protein n=1 Tax=Opisthorchis felineus TaxID=147828 RepID=A0A4S2LRA5_OPIFE|nr:hypothetical protein CRM22_005715 [Opisthorchis felineus]TGZ65746.1 hypothetical protein CRM22_005715 [Opisthorchis felineus]